METQNRQSLSEWEEIFAEQKASGLIVSRFCEGRGISAGSFRSAVKRKAVVLARAKHPSIAITGSDYAMPKSSGYGDTASSLPFVSLRVRPERGGDSAAVSSQVRVQLRSGHQLWVAPGFDATHLSRLMAVLESVS